MNALIRQLACFIGLLLFSFSLNAQTLPANRSVDWSLAGIRGPLPSIPTVVSIVTFGGVGDGSTPNDQAFTQAVNSLSGGPGVIFFPSGDYLFNAPIDLESNTILQGASIDSTTLRFDLGGSDHAIRITGKDNLGTTTIPIDVNKDALVVPVDDPTGFAVGDYVKISEDDVSLVTSNWAEGSTGQIARIESISGSDFTLESPLRRDYLISRTPELEKLEMVTNVGIEDLRIVRVDATSGQTSNIYFNYAANCWVSCVESNRCNFSHVELSNSTNIEVKGSYFHDAFDYGNGGKAYGVTLHFTSGENLVENNIFDHLRHSMLLQAGANGNVLAYNYSRDPFWTGVILPSNSAGDAVLHGNYPYANLFEGNIIQNIVIDDSHDINGPYNTFFRNRAELYGIFMNNSPASDDQNFIGNEIPNTSGSLLGLYALSGSGHFEHGNNHQGTIKPTGTSALPDTSYYLDTIPEWFQNNSNWPPIGTPNPMGDFDIEAKDRFDNGILVACLAEEDTTISVNELAKVENSLVIFPNPAENELFLQTDAPVTGYRISTLQGQLVREEKLSELRIDLSTLEGGVYLIDIFLENQLPISRKLIRK